MYIHIHPSRARRHGSKPPAHDFFDLQRGLGYSGGLMQVPRSTEGLRAVQCDEGCGILLVMFSSPDVSTE